MKALAMALGCLAALLAIGCDRAQERALADLEVGGARSGGVSFTVVDGLACVHRIDPGELSLWIGAPSIEIVATAELAGSWELELANAMPAASLEVVAGSARIAQVGGALATTRRYLVELERGTTRLRFATPDERERAPWRFALLSDIQTAMPRVFEVFAKINQEPGLSFLLGAGDLSQRGTREELERFQRELAALDIPYYTTLGNHDAPTSTPWHAIFGRGNFRFRFRGVQFSMLDSASASIDPLAYDWLADWLDEGLGQMHIMAMHIPAFDPVGTRNAAFGSRNEAGKLMHMLAEGGVDLTLYGHIHSFYQFDNGGIPAFISGGGGAIPERGDGVGRHFLVFELSADEGLLTTKLVQVDD